MGGCSLESLGIRLSINGASSVPEDSVQVPGARQLLVKVRDRSSGEDECVCQGHNARVASAENRTIRPWLNVVDEWTTIRLRQLSRLLFWVWFEDNLMKTCTHVRPNTVGGNRSRQSNLQQVHIPSTNLKSSIEADRKPREDGRSNCVRITPVAPKRRRRCDLHQALQGGIYGRLIQRLALEDLLLKSENQILIVQLGPVDSRLHAAAGPWAFGRLAFVLVAEDVETRHGIPRVISPAVLASAVDG